VLALMLKEAVALTGGTDAKPSKRVFRFARGR